MTRTFIKRTRCVMSILTVVKKTETCHVNFDSFLENKKLPETSNVNFDSFLENKKKHTNLILTFF